MARILGEGAVKVGDVTWRLRFDMNVLADLQEVTGKPIEAVLAELQGGIDAVTTLRVVCHQMLLHHQPEATIRDAGGVLSEDMEAVMAIIVAAMPQPGEGDLGNAKAKAGRPQ
jgi:hypothetical protein